MMEMELAHWIVAQSTIAINANFSRVSIVLIARSDIIMILDNALPYAEMAYYWVMRYAMTVTWIIMMGVLPIVLFKTILHAIRQSIKHLFASLNLSLSNMSIRSR
jgi:hypothetical protein